MTDKTKNFAWKSDSVSSRHEIWTKGKDMYTAQLNENCFCHCHTTHNLCDCNTALYHSNTLGGA